MENKETNNRVCGNTEDFVSNSEFIEFKKATEENIEGLNNKIEKAIEGQGRIENNLDIIKGSVDRLVTAIESNNFKQEAVNDKLEDKIDFLSESFGKYTEMSDKLTEERMKHINTKVEESLIKFEENTSKYSGRIEAINKKIEEHDEKIAGTGKDKAVIWTSIVTGVISVIIALINILPSLLGK